MPPSLPTVGHQTGRSANNVAAAMPLTRRRPVSNPTPGNARLTTAIRLAKKRRIAENCGSLGFPVVLRGCKYVHAV